VRNPFLEYLELWLPNILREKAIASAGEDRLLYIGASDFSVMLADYILTQLAQAPASCWTCCHLDQVNDEEIMESTGFAAEVVAAGFIGSVIELTPWQGDVGVQFLVSNNVPIDDAREFSAAIDVIAEKLGARGQELLQKLDAVARRSAFDTTTAV